MKLSIRTKVLAAYALLVVLALLALFTGLTQVKTIGTRLNFIRTQYLPIVRTNDAFAHLYHLDEAFDVRKIIANRDSDHFVDSFRLASETVIETGLRRQLKDAEVAIAEHPSGQELSHLKRISELAEELIKQHKKYLSIIYSILDESRTEKPEKVLLRTEELLAQKRIVRSRIEFFSRRLDQRIQNSIFAADAEARKAVLWAVAFSVLTVLVAILVGLISLFTLRPLERLKETARRIAEGELNRRVEIHSTDEIGELAHEFNRMADSIQLRDEALRKQQENLVQSEKMAVVGRMASKISHEVRNPLNALGLNVEMLSDEVHSPEAKKTLGAMSHEIDRLNAVAENYLSMARGGVIQREETDVAALISGLTSFVGPEMEMKRFRFEVDLAPDLPQVRADAARLEQALINLVKNSMEASPPEGKIGIRASRIDREIEIEVWDEGAGIPLAAIDHIFDPFFTTKDRGTGLGLSITREIVVEAGGTIECRSSVGRGTTFTVNLPISTP